jgi:hypothetical protein
MTKLLRLALVTALALSLVVTAGCGGDTKNNNDYVKAVNKAQADFVDSLGKTGTSGSVEQRFQSIQDAIGKVISDIKAVTPPDEVKDLHQEVIDEMTQLRGEVGDLSDAIKVNDLKKLEAAQEKFTTDATELQTKFQNTVNEINQKLRD